MLAWLLSSYLQQAARERIFAAMQEAAEGSLKGKKGEKGQGDDDSPPPPPPCQVAILCAHEAEAGGLIDLLEEPESFQTALTTEYAGKVAGRQVVVVLTGAGRAAATAAAEETIRLYHPEWVIAAGFASGLGPAIRRRHIVMPASLVEPGGRTLSVGFQLDAAALGSKSLHATPLLTLEQPSASLQEKQALAERHAVGAADTESFWIADACRAAKTRFLAIRVISDAIDDPFPPDIAVLLRQKSVAGQVGAGLMALWRRLGSAGDLWQLQEDAVKATDTLARFVFGMLPQLVSQPADAPRLSPPSTPADASSPR